MYESSAALEGGGVKFKKKPDEGGMKGLAFAYDSDGYDSRPRPTPPRRARTLSTSRPGTPRRASVPDAACGGSRPGDRYWVELIKRGQSGKF